MDPVTASIVLRLVGLGMEYGIPAVMGIVQSWDKEKITDQDLDELESKLKHPGEYLPRP